jgi:hypothetical protein
MLAPFHFGIDQQNRIWVTNAVGEHVTRFPASDPSKAEKFTSGWSGSGLGIDSQGNVWVTNRLGNSLRGAAVVVDMVVTSKLGGNIDEKLTRAMSKQRGGRDGGNVSLLRPDGSHFPESPFTAGGLPGPPGRQPSTATTTYGSPPSPRRTVRSRSCAGHARKLPSGLQDGQQIAPPGGYVGGGLQMQTDLAISPVGDVWLMNNWQDIDSCFGAPDEARSTRCGGQGVTILFGMPKPVRSPQIGPAQGLE